jgi:tetratricopeptide (TPR) repeat protein
VDRLALSPWPAVFAVLALLGCSEEGGSASSAPTAVARYVGAAACAECHASEWNLWSGSHHDLAMAPATEATVLGDFDDAVLQHGGVRSEFFMADERFVVRTEGPSGELRDFPIDYVFGVDPLQQYLVAFPDGRYQALSLCWDTRPAAAGGQRWFHLYPDETIPPGDALHWTGPQANWNHMCADCHSTNLVKGYDLATDVFETTWSDIDVACEACHGPGSNHLDWAARAESGEVGGETDDLGLTVRLKQERRWVFDTDEPIARREPPVASRAEVETCARCHSRRSRIARQDVPGTPLLDVLRPVLLDEGLYHADGQIDDEVYVFGSFLQSRMFHEGVTCSDCHQPHTTEVMGSADGVCVRCHRPEEFAVPEHHGHEVGTAGAGCVECHMPATTYMVVDPRRDHSFRVPRPDLTLTLGTPNACNGCHTDESAAWAAAAIEEWHGPRTEHFGEILAAGRQGAADAAGRLAALIDDPETAGIVRATALAESAAVLDPELLAAVTRGLADENALIRYGALRALEGADALERAGLAAPRLDDPILLVRIAAAQILAPVPPDSLKPSVARRVDEVLDEYRTSLLVDADRAVAHLNLGVLALDRGELATAEGEYRLALQQDPTFAAAAVNLSDLLRGTGRDEEGERVLLAVLERAPDDGDAHHALGLLLVRTGDLDAAVESLGRAAELRPEVARYAYVQGVALNSTGRADQAVAVLLSAQARHPHDAQLLFALATIHRDMGDPDQARIWARQLVEIRPGDPGARQLLDDLLADG